MPVDPLVFAIDPSLNSNSKIWILVATSDTDLKISEIRNAVIEARYENVVIDKELSMGISRESFDHVAIVCDSATNLTPLLGAAFEALRPKSKISVVCTTDNQNSLLITQVALAGFINISFPIVPHGTQVVAEKIAFSSTETVPLKLPAASTSKIDDDIIDERSLLAEEDFKKPDTAACGVPGLSHLSFNKILNTEEDNLHEKRENVKQIFNSSKSAFENPFEFMRQQENGGEQMPELTQFKASQKLLNPDLEKITHLNESNSKEEMLNAITLLMTENRQLCDQVEKTKSVSNEHNKFRKTNNSQKKPYFTDGYDTKEVFDVEDASYDDLEMTDEDYVIPESTTVQRLDEMYSFKEWEKIFEEQEKGWSFTTIQQIHKKLKFPEQIRRMKIYMQKNGSRLQQISDINTQVMEFIFGSCNKLKEIHDRDLEDIALLAARRIGAHDFKACHTYIQNLKKKCNAVSRKVTKYVTEREIKDKPNLEAAIKAFHDKVAPVMDTTPHEKIWNADQTGIKQEMITGRTLAFKGQKQVHCVVQNVNALKRSYTVQAVISAAGELMLPVLVCFCEPKLPKKFKKWMIPFKNIYAVQSKSGLMTSLIGIEWFENVFKPNAGEDPVLIVDSWNGYIKAFDQDKDNIDFYILPPKSTSTEQPLDVYWNRPFKNFIRVFSSKLRHIGFKVSNRHGMATIIDLTIGQFAAPRFHLMVKYAWYASNYLKESVPKGDTPVKYCFDQINVDSKCDCEEDAFIRCSHCSKFLCYHHFVEKMHRCYEIKFEKTCDDPDDDPDDDPYDIESMKNDPFFASADSRSSSANNEDKDEKMPDVITDLDIVQETNYEFHPPNDKWFETLCTKLNLSPSLVSMSLLRTMLSVSKLTIPSTTYDPDGDGNCGFRALSYLLFGTEDYHWIIRTVITWWRVQRGDGEAVKSWAKIKDKSPFSTLKDKSLWMSDEDMIAFAKIFCCNILLYTSQGVPSARWRCYSNSDTYNWIQKPDLPSLCLSLPGNHYYAVTAFKRGRGRPRKQ
uniref:OTU domain-containing protein n=1 Tax=Panagrolaimus davidi TaxID=227884 RepID=A0A914QHG6_9BILA